MLLQEKGLYSNAGTTSEIFFLDKKKYVAKRLRRKGLESLRLQDPRNRQDIRDAEMTFHTSVNPSLKVSLEVVRFEEERDECIVMRLIDPGHFLNNRLENNNIPTGTFTGIADAVADYHSDVEICPSTKDEVPSFSLFMHDIIIGGGGELGEIEILRGLYPEKGEILNSWKRQLSEIMINKSDLLDYRREVLEEPFFCQGDLEKCNIVIEKLSDKNQVLILDPTPKREWRIISPITEIDFLVTDLILSGYIEEAKELHNQYMLRYRNDVLPKRLGFDPSNDDMFEESNKAIDDISMLYRTLIFCRLCKYRNEPDRLKASFDLVEHLLLERDWREFEPLINVE